MICGHIGNREWWRRRVRMYTPSAAEHARKIRLVHKLIQEVEPLKSEYTEKLGEYMNAFERKASEGLFEELVKVSLFQWDGTDSNGLDLWLRKHGSTRAESFHQKLRAALGPWGVGARSAHYIMLLVTFQYNLHTGIMRCGEHNFGHPWLQYVDRIQTRIMNIFGSDIYPRHVNIE